MALLLTAAAWAVLHAHRAPATRESFVVHTNLLRLFRDAEYVRASEHLVLGSRRGRVFTEEPDLRRLDQATGLLTFPDGEPPYAWIVGRRAGFDLEVLEREPRTLSLTLIDGLGGEQQQSFRLLFNGRELLDTPLQRIDTQQTFRVDVPAQIQRRGANRVELVFARTESRALMGRPVPLPLAALITRARFLTEDQPDDHFRKWPQRLGLVHRPRGGESRSELVIPPETCVRLGLRLPDRERLLLRLVVDEPREALDLSLQLGLNERVPLGRLDVDPAAQPGGTRRVDLDLGVWAGRDAVLELWSRGAQHENVVRVAQLRTKKSDPPAPEPVRVSGERERPSFLVVLLDALARSRVGAYAANGESLTPRLDALAARGLLVERASAPASYTLASVGALLTGQNPLTHGVVQLSDSAGFQRLPQDTPRLATSLQSAGWRTSAFVTNPNAGAVHGYDAGFETYHELFADKALWNDGVDGAQLAPRLANFLASVDTDPYLAYVHVFEPHAPYNAPADLLAEHVQPYNGPARGDRAWLDAVKHGEVRLDDAGWTHLRELYAARVALADRVLGELLDALERSGRADDTLVLVTSDHGEAFGEHGWIEHGDHVYAEQVDVPLVLAGPGLSPARVSGPATLEDIAPTLLPLAGVSVPPNMEGRDLLAAAQPERALHARSAAALPVFSWTRWPWRLHVDTATRRVRLHDLDSDPQERVDLSDLQPATTLVLQQELTRAVRDAALRDRQVERVEVSDPERLQQLAQIGYAAKATEPEDEPALPAEVVVLTSMLQRL